MSANVCTFCNNAATSECDGLYFCGSCEATVIDSINTTRRSDGDQQAATRRTNEISPNSSAVEQRLCKSNVGGSIPSSGSTINNPAPRTVLASSLAPQPAEIGATQSPVSAFSTRLSDDQIATFLSIAANSIASRSISDVPLQSA